MQCSHSFYICLLPTRRHLERRIQIVIVTTVTFWRCLTYVRCYKFFNICFLFVSFINFSCLHNNKLFVCVYVTIFWFTLFSFFCFALHPASSACCIGCKLCVVNFTNHRYKYNIYTLSHCARLWFRAEHHLTRFTNIHTR